MSFLALLALALGQQPCPHASKNCPQAQVQRCQEGRGCLVLAEAEDEIDMGEAEFLADPMDDQVIAAAAKPKHTIVIAAAAKPKHTISLGLGWGKDKPVAVTVVFTKKKEEEGKEERIQGQFYSFGPVVSRCEVIVRSEDEDEDEACEECPAAKAAACEKCPAAKTAACDQCPASKAAACEKCPAAKAAACGKCVEEKCGSGKACDSCAQCPGEKNGASGAKPGAVVQVQALAAPASATVASAAGTENGKQARRRLIRRR